MIGSSSGFTSFWLIGVGTKEHQDNTLKAMSLWRMDMAAIICSFELDGVKYPKKVLSYYDESASWDGSYQQPVRVVAWAVPKLFSNQIGCTLPEAEQHERWPWLGGVFRENPIWRLGPVGYIHVHDNHMNSLGEAVSKGDSSYLCLGVRFGELDYPPEDDNDRQSFIFYPSIRKKNDPPRPTLKELAKIGDKIWRMGVLVYE